MVKVTVGNAHAIACNKTHSYKQLSRAWDVRLQQYNALWKQYIVVVVVMSHSCKRDVWSQDASHDCDGLVHCSVENAAVLYENHRDRLQKNTRQPSASLSIFLFQPTLMH